MGKKQKHTKKEIEIYNKKKIRKSNKKLKITEGIPIYILSYIQK